jgi:antitoxin CptB
MSEGKAIGGGTGGVSDLEVRRRRALWRANHRGTKEMDLMIGAYARQMLAAMHGPDLDLFERMLAVPDPELNAWLLDPEPVIAEQFRQLMGDIRRFHGLAG